MRGAHGGTGVALVESFDLVEGVDSELANISTRSLVETGDRDRAEADAALKKLIDQDADDAAPARSPPRMPCARNPKDV